VKNVGTTLATRPLQGSFWRDEDARLSSALVSAMSKDFVGALLGVALAETLGKEDRHLHPSLRARSSDPKTVGGFALEDLSRRIGLGDDLLKKAARGEFDAEMLHGVLKGRPKALIQAALKETHLARTRMAGAERVAAEEAEGIQRRQAADAETRGDAVPADEDTITLLLRLGTPPERLIELGASPRDVLLATQKRLETALEEEQMSRLREEYPDEAWEERGIARIRRGADELIGRLQARALVEACGGDLLDAGTVRTRLRDYVGSEAPAAGSPARASWEGALEKLQRRLRSGDDPEETVQALSAFRQYERNLQRMRECDDRVGFFEIQRENQALSAVLKRLGIEIVPPETPQPATLQATLRRAGLPVDASGSTGVSTTVPTDAGPTRVKVAIDESLVEERSTRAQTGDGYQVDISAHVPPPDAERALGDELAAIKAEQSDRVRRRAAATRQKTRK